MIYLNNGTHSKTPPEVMEAIWRYQRDAEENPTAKLFNTWERLWEVQKELAAFFGASGQELFLRPNITASLNALILGVKNSAIQPGGEILTTDLEYGAISNTCRFRAERDGRALRAIALPVDARSMATLSSADWTRLIVDEIRSDTRMLVLSHVISGNGLVLPLEKIAAETRKRGILLIVDGAHAPGAFPLDFRTLQNVDFYAGNLHKWMMGPKGTSFGWVPRRTQSLLEPITAGWTSYDIPGPFQKFGDGDRFPLRMLQAASLDFAPYFAIHDLLAYWRAQGAEKIYARINALKRLARTEAERELGWPCLTPSDPELWGPLTAFELPEPFQSEGFGFMHRVLREKDVQIITSMLKGRFVLRLSPHAYNTEEEVRQGVRRIKELVGRSGAGAGSQT